MQTPDNTRTVNELLDRYEKEAVPQLASRTQKDYAKYIVTLRQTFGTRIASHLRGADIEGFLRVPEGAKGGIHRNRIISALSAVLVTGMSWGWVTHNACSNVPRNRAKTKRRVLTDGEFEGLRKLAKPRVRVAMDLAILTRQPQGNLLGLRWEQVDEHVIRFRDPKTRTKVEVEITPEIRKVLDACRALPKSGEFVISSRSGTRYSSAGFRAVWQRLITTWARRGNDRFDFHDIRATAQRRFTERQARKTELTSAVAEYPQFESSLRQEAEAMAEYYQVFYCLEQKIRQLIVSRMTAAAGADWWDTTTRVPTDTKANANKNRQREIESAITPRSDEMINYTTFGELSGIITSNWDLFEPAFHNKAAIGRVLHALNLLRGPIAHSCAMTSDEVHRLGILVRDWFRQLKE